MTKELLMRTCSAGLLAVGLAATSGADILKLKDGTVVSGVFVGGDRSTIQLQVGREVRDYAIEAVESLSFEELAPPAAPAPAAATPASQPPAPASGAQGLPQGTKLMVRNVDAIVSGRSGKGSRFAAVLDAPVSLEGNLVLAAGTKLYGQVVESQAAGPVVKRAKLVVTLTEAAIGDQVVPIATDTVGAEGGPAGTLRKVGAGVLIGAVFDGSRGAGRGAAIGGGLSLLTPGNQIQIPPKTLIEFHLTKPVTIR